MTDSTERVLASIDETLDGYATWDPGTSSDAMRWRPEQPPQPAKAYWAPMGTLAEGPESWTELGYVDGDGFRLPDVAENIEAARRLNDQLTMTIRANLDAVTSAFAALAQGVQQGFRVFSDVARRNHPVIAAAKYGDDYRRHRRACRLCNPAGNPRPLKVNGAEYRRRTQSRKRRNRR